MSPRPIADGARHRRGGERLLHLPPGARRRPFLHRLEAAELEPGQADVAGPAHRDEPEVGEEVRRRRSVGQHALVARRAFRVAVAERLDRLDAPVSSFRSPRGRGSADPGRGGVDEIGAGDEHRVGEGGPEGRSTARGKRPAARTGRSRAGGFLRRGRASPGSPLVLDLLGPALLVDRPPASSTARRRTPRRRAGRRGATPP